MCVIPTPSTIYKKQRNKTKMAWRHTDIGECFKPAITFFKGVQTCALTLKHQAVNTTACLLRLRNLIRWFLGFREPRANLKKTKGFWQTSPFSWAHVISLFKLQSLVPEPYWKQETEISRWKRKRWKRKEKPALGYPGGKSCRTEDLNPRHSGFCSSELSWGHWCNQKW